MGISDITGGLIAVVGITMAVSAPWIARATSLALIAPSHHESPLARSIWIGMAALLEGIACLLILSGVSALGLIESALAARLEIGLSVGTTVVWILLLGVILTALLRPRR